MKKLVVVIENMMVVPSSKGPYQSNIEKIEFTGENLQAINKSDMSALSSAGDPLIIKNSSEVLAVFRVWNYWQKLE